MESLLSKIVKAVLMLIVTGLILIFLLGYPTSLGLYILKLKNEIVENLIFSQVGKLGRSFIDILTLSYLLVRYIIENSSVLSYLQVLSLLYILSSIEITVPYNFGIFEKRKIKLEKMIQETVLALLFYSFAVIGASAFIRSVVFFRNSGKLLLIVSPTIAIIGPALFAWIAVPRIFFIICWLLRKDKEINELQEFIYSKFIEK